MPPYQAKGDGPLPLTFSLPVLPVLVGGLAVGTVTPGELSSATVGSLVGELDSTGVVLGLMVAEGFGGGDGEAFGLGDFFGVGLGVALGEGFAVVFGFGLGEATGFGEGTGRGESDGEGCGVGVVS